MAVFKIGCGIGSAPWTVPVSWSCLLELGVFTQPEHRDEQGQGM